ncbi:MAG: YraN family protein [Saprospiraceae bacterium]|nr:YraN family protein [Saprospiraceae bacterium]
MAYHNDLGKKGEEIAVNFLKNKGYSILEVNWRYRKSEIDIIAKDQEVLVFIEVKSRSNDLYGRPESFVDQRKQNLIVDGATAYMEKINHDWEVRFDIVAVFFHNEVYQSVDHFKDAFFPGF